MLGGFTVSLSHGVLNVAIPSMMSSLGADLDRIQWVQIAFQIVQAVFIPAVGWLSARVGTKQLFILSTLIFITGSALSGLAWNVESLIVFRIMQGMGGGLINPLSMSMLFSTFPPDKRGLALGLSSFTRSFGPAIAPALGGHLIEVLSWRAIFYINVPVGLLSMALVFFTMPPTQEERERPFDALGVLTMACCIIPLLLALSEGRRYGWTSQMILTLFFVSAVSLVAFIVAELNTSQPFVNIRLYRNAPFTMGCIIALINTTEFRGTNFLLPIMLQRIYHYPPFQTGLFFLPPALVMGVTSILAGRLSDIIQPKVLLIMGLLTLCYASLQFAQVDIWTTSAVLLGLIILRRAAQAFCNAPLSSSTLRGVSEDQVRMASGLFTFHRTLGGAVGVALSATLLNYRQDVRLLMLSEQQALYPLGTDAAADTVRTALMQEGLSDDALSQMTANMLQRQLTAEAALAGYHDIFIMFAGLALFALIPVLLLRRVGVTRGSRE